MSKAATQLEDVLAAEFPGIRFGRYNCRLISGSDTWSQHSWPGGNARDLYAPEDHTDPMAFVDEVVEWLETHKEALSVRLILWRTTDHYSHAHADMWPHGYGTPPCADGDEQWEYSDGRVFTGSDPGPENGVYDDGSYKGVANVPEWGEGIVDWGIETGLIVTDDNYPDDWEDDKITMGRMWTLFYRFSTGG